MAKKKTKKKKVQNKKPPEITPYPQAGQPVKEFEQKLDEQIKDESDTRRGRGRPRKEPAPAPPALAEVPDEVIANFVKIPFDLWAASQNVAQLKLTDKEANLIATPAKQLLDYYLPKIPTIAWAWVALSMTSYSVMSIRLQMIAKIKKHKTESRYPPPQGKAGPESDGARPETPSGPAEPAKAGINQERIKVQKL